MRRLPPLPTICMVSALGAEVPGSVVSTMADTFLVFPASAPSGGTGTSETVLQDSEACRTCGGVQLGTTWGLGVVCPHSCATGASAPGGRNSTPTPLFLASPMPLLYFPEQAMTGCLQRDGLAVPAFFSPAHTYIPPWFL